MSMTESSGGSTQRARLAGVAMSESWAGEAFSSGYPGSFADDPAGNQEHWSGRMPPQDSDAEQSVLGSMLISKDAIADVNEQIGGGDFYRPAHETIYDAIVDLYGRGEPADPVTVSAELHRRGELQKVGGAPYLHTLSASVPIAANAGYYATIVREKAILRRLVDAGTKIAQMGYAGEGDVDQTVDVAQQEIYAIGEKRQQEDYAPLSSIMEATLDEIEAISSHDGTTGGVPTGFADLDELVNGFSGGQMIIVAARPAVGKSTLALDFCRSASIHNNLTSVIFSLEMSKSEITMRLLSAEAKIPLNNIRKGPMTDEDWNKLGPQDGPGLRGADVHRRQPQHDDDGDPRQGSPAQAAPRPEADRDRLPAADDERQEGRVAAGRGLGVLPADQAAGQGARRPHRRDLPAQPWPRAALGQAADDERPARVGLPDRRHPVAPCGHQRRGHHR